MLAGVLAWPIPEIRTQDSSAPAPSVTSPVPPRPRYSLTSFEICARCAKKKIRSRRQLAAIKTTLSLLRPGILSIHLRVLAALH